MKKLLCLLLLVPVIAFAFPCKDYEYAELKDMDKATFEAEYCEIVKTVVEKADTAVKIDTNREWKELDSCMEVSKKMERVYKQRFKEDIPKCPDKAKKEKEVWPDRIKE